MSLSQSVPKPQDPLTSLSTNYKAVLKSQKETRPQPLNYKSIWSPSMWISQEFLHPKIPKTSAPNVWISNRHWGWWTKSTAIVLVKNLVLRLKWHLLTPRSRPLTWSLISWRPRSTKQHLTYLRRSSNIRSRQLTFNISTDSWFRMKCVQSKNLYFSFTSDRWPNNFSPPFWSNFPHHRISEMFTCRPQSAPRLPGFTFRMPFLLRVTCSTNRRSCSRIRPMWWLRTWWRRVRKTRNKTMFSWTAKSSLLSSFSASWKNSKCKRP